MMQANELRIGNYIRLFDTKECYKIHLVSKGVVQVEGEILGGEVLKTNNINPIPLTPEILEKCGFVWSHLEEEYVLTSKVGVIFLSKDGYSVSTGTNDSFIRIFGLTCKYLHQLQNLYFALTGEELNVQL